MAPRPKEELETVIPKTLSWLRDIAPTLPSPVNCARILVAAATIERLQKERDDLSKRFERMHRPRCEGYSDDPEGPWPLLQNPCQFCGSRSESDACRDMADTADCDKIREERDAAQAEVERLKGEVKWWKREAATGQDNVNFITQQERDWR